MILWAFFPFEVCSLTPATIKHKTISVTIVCTPTPFFWGWNGVEILTKNLVTFKRLDGAKDEIF